MRYCTSCGTPLNSPQRYCTRCGQPNPHTSEPGSPATTPAPTINKRWLALGATAAAAVILLTTLIALGGIGETGTAMSLKPTADSIAQEWRQDAELYSIIGYEGIETVGTSSSSMPPDEQAYRERMHELAIKDSSIGDGKANVWAFDYGSLTGDAVRIILDKDGKTIAVDEKSSPYGGIPLDADLIDSTDAAAAARQSINIETQPASGGYTLFSAEQLETSIWVISTGTWHATVDAKTGKVLDVRY